MPLEVPCCVQDGQVCLHDGRCGARPAITSSPGPGSNNKIGALCFHAAASSSPQPLLYCARGSDVHMLDLRAASGQAASAACCTGSQRSGAAEPGAQAQGRDSSCAVVHSFHANKDEVSCLAVDDRGRYLVAGDDSGEVWFVLCFTCRGTTLQLDEAWQVTARLAARTRASCSSQWTRCITHAAATLTCQIPSCVGQWLFLIPDTTAPQCRLGCLS
jgi:hypothetical protein